MEEHEFSKEIIDKYLYGYKDIRLVSSEEVINTFQKDTHRHGLPMSPPLSPRKIRTPDEVSLCTSSIPGMVFGACSIKKIAQGTWFGPFEGKLVRTTEVTKSKSNEYMWEIFHDGEVSHYLDGFNENNWMSFVRCARHKKEQNLVVFQYHGCIYYRCMKDILPGQELLVWYDTKYTQLLGIPLAWNDNRNSSTKRKNIQTETDAPKKRKSTSPIMLLQQSHQTTAHASPKRTKTTGDINTLIEVSKKLQEKPDFPMSPTIPLHQQTYPSTNQSHILSNQMKRSLDYQSYEKHIDNKPLQRLSIAAAIERDQQPRLRLPSLDSLSVNSNPFRPMHLTTPYADPRYYYKNYYNIRNFPSPPLDPLKHMSTMDPLKHMSNVHQKSSPMPIKNF